MAVLYATWFTLASIISGAPEPDVLLHSHPLKTEQPQEIESSDRLSHLREAIDHLSAAGLPEEVARVEAVLKKVRSEQKALLVQKRRQLDSLQQEISKLEADLGEGQFVIDVTVGEIDLNQLQKMGLSLESLQLVGKESGKTRIQALPRTLSTDEFQKSLKVLKEASAVKVTAQPRVVTFTGRPATIKSGGAFPIPVAQSDGQMRLDHREFGMTLEAVVHAVSEDEFRLEIVYETKEQDHANAVDFQGTKVPGLNVRRVNTKAQMKDNETLCLAGMTQEDKGESKIWFVACSPERNHPLATQR